MRVLILHGWMHRPELYSQLLTDFPNVDINLYQYKVYKKNVLNNLANDIAYEIANTDYNIILAHSMGCNILLRALSGNKIKSKIILLNPVYGHIYWAIPLLPFIGLKNKFLLRQACKLTMYENHNDVEKLISCALSWDTSMARNSLLELIFTKVSNNDYLVVKGSKDWISREKADIIIPNVGHTLIIEAYEYIRRLIDEEII